jgi:hypothetical protein
MDIHAATETAYKNGYEAGVLITSARIFEELDILVDDWKHNRIQSIQFIDEIAKLKKKFEAA